MVDMVDTVMISWEGYPGSPTMTVPIYEQFAEAIRTEIRLGRLKPGDRLPSTAAYVEAGWKRSSIVAGMRVLRTEGWVRGQPGQAVYVADNPPIE